MSTEKINFDRFARKKQELKSRLSCRNPKILADNTLAKFLPNNSGGGEFILPLWDEEIIVSYPEFHAVEKNSGNKLSELDLVTLLYYFGHADRTPLSGKWISYSELPDGQFYNQAFQGYTGKVLARTFSNNRDAFNMAAVRAGGERYELGDSGFIFKIPQKCQPWLYTGWEMRISGHQPRSCSMKQQATIYLQMLMPYWEARLPEKL